MINILILLRYSGILVTDLSYGHNSYEIIVVKMIYFVNLKSVITTELNRKSAIDTIDKMDTYFIKFGRE